MRDIKSESKTCGINMKEPNSYFELGSYTDINNQSRPQFILSKKGILLISARYDARIRLALIEKIEELESDNMPATYIQALEKLLSTEKEKQLLLEDNKVLSIDNKVMKPKAEFFDAVSGSKDAIEMSQVAKVLDIRGYGRNNLFAFLRDNNILRHNNEPYQEYVDKGYFRVLEQKYMTNDGEIRINIKTLVYQKGLDYIRKLISYDN